MIYTVTFNPSLDYIVDVKDFKQGLTNRTSEEHILPGGKGINVSIVLGNMGIESTALGFMAGFTGSEIVRLLENFKIKTSFIPLQKGFSRINVKMRSEEETEINGSGPNINEAALTQLFEQLDTLQEDDWLILAGSIPASMPKNIYERIMQRLETKKVRVVVDATGELLLNVLKYKPYLIKPNNHELSEIAGRTLTTRQELADAARALQKQGAQNVIISMAGDGAIFVAPDGTDYFSPAPKGELRNSVGAGDSMVAGFVTGTVRGETPENVFKRAVATGSASAFSENLATEEEVNALLLQMAQ